MNLFEDLIKFLENKALIIIDKHKNVFEGLIENNDKIAPNLHTIFIEIKKQISHQAQLDEILNFLSDLLKIKNESLVKENSFLEINLEQFINSQLQQIVDNEILFNSKHPLFGFQPFHKRLIECFAELELFEKCSEINTNIK